MTTALVVGSGPNGLAAAVTLARAGVDVTVLEAAETIGGGTRSSEATVPGLIHDHCSAFHPMGIGSPFMRDLDLASLGVTWRWAPAELAHPLDGGRAAILRRDIAATAESLGVDGRAWERLFGPLAERFDRLAEDLMGPLLRVPRHPLALATFGPRALMPAAAVARRWKTDEARALYAGVAAHAIYPLGRPTSSAIGLILTAVGHRFGWPVAEGGSQAIADGLARDIVDHGGRIETGTHVRSLDDLPPSDIVMLDLAPTGVLEVAGDRLPRRMRRAYAKYRYGPSAFKIDLAVEGGIPWTDLACGEAGTVHLGGTLTQIADAERQVWAGRMPEAPFVLVGQQYLADPTRSRGDVHPVWAYAHVPHGYDGDATEAILGQIERFAPGARDRIVATSVTTPADFAGANPNFVGGDIITGANTPLQMVMRPRIAWNPYATGIDGVYICSAATPPGPGVHGMGGYHAARTALRKAKHA